MPKIAPRANVIIKLLGMITLIVGIAILGVALNLEGGGVSDRVFGYLIGGILTLLGIGIIVVYVEEE
ncbi:MAG TPA: hypothetical protein ENF47_05625 [Thermoprotei archaeon]|nr:hypothetical protein [Thermoprotei archaeon]